MILVDYPLPLPKKNIPQQKHTNENSNYIFILHAANSLNPKNINKIHEITEKFMKLVKIS